MSENLVIVESPAKAKTIGKFLGNGYKVIASNGHVRDLPKSQLGVDVEHDFAPKYITLRGRGDVLERIRKEAKNAKTVYLATDPDMEGEAISWHLAQILKLDTNTKCRIVFNEITSGTVKKSVKAARTINMDLVDAQQARRVLDRLVGYKISPILWAKVRKGLSAGRVQSVATRILCDREQEIMDFVSEEYWTVSATLKHKGARKPIEAKFYGFGGKKAELHNEADADEVISRAAKGDFAVTDRKIAEKVRSAPAPFTTSSMQQEASRKLGFTAKLTMLVAQQLYEGIDLQGKGATGLITYMRTDSVRIADEAQQQALAEIKTQYGEKYVPAKPNVFKGRKGAQDAHEAIRPANVSLTPQAVKASLSNQQFKLYKLIYERFLASQMAPAVFETNTVTFDAGGCTFRANGVRTIFDGYTAVYTEGKDEAQEKDVTLPELSVGEMLAAQKLDKEQKFTQPPPRYTEATLVKTLEERGIGRPSTYSPTISTILERGYVRREKKQLVPTELGFIVTQLMKDNFKDIVDVKFTADMESKLDLIKDIKQNRRARIKVYADEVPGATYHEGCRNIWDVPCDVALPCATQNEVDVAEAKKILEGGAMILTEGANMPCTLEAVAMLQAAGLPVGPAKAANAGGVSTSALEMTQNSMRLSWTFEEVDERLHNIMRGIYKAAYDASVEAGQPGNLVVGANIASFLKIADAMLHQGIV